MVRDWNRTRQSHPGHRPSSVRPLARELPGTALPGPPRPTAAGLRRRSADRVTLSCEGATLYADPGYDRVPTRTDGLGPTPMGGRTPPGNPDQESACSGLANQGLRRSPSTVPAIKREGALNRKSCACTRRYTQATPEHFALAL
jgi:hypothetical protein